MDRRFRPSEKSKYTIFDNIKKRESTSKGSTRYYVLNSYFAFVNISTPRMKSSTIHETRRRVARFKMADEKQRRSKRQAKTNTTHGTLAKTSNTRRPQTKSSTTRGALAKRSTTLSVIGQSKEQKIIEFFTKRRAGKPLCHHICDSRK